ncbi:hypothetical protein CDL15_Pgr005797 [Punica granatum]|uniref:Uncharacterized protein n=1 Tax=Punica granatum TaxID=22663 RepID=A0A218WGY5_PUNGR|nr:hypothetical protein CDL15_Pgr005797 [Punica granatum]
MIFLIMDYPVYVNMRVDLITFISYNMTREWSIPKFDCESITRQAVPKNNIDDSTQI